MAHEEQEHTWRSRMAGTVASGAGALAAVVVTKLVRRRLQTHGK
jgi:hypothetical protein